MTDERRDPPADTIVGFQALISDLRDDVREDIREVRDAVTGARIEIGQVTARVASVEVNQKAAQAYIESFAGSHSEQHESERRESERTHSVFYEFIRKAELDQARRDGALGILRYSIELLSKHAPRLIALIVAVATFLGFVTGNVHVDLGGMST